MTLSSGQLRKRLDISLSTEWLSVLMWLCSMKWSYSGVRGSQRRRIQFSFSKRMKTASKHHAPPTYSPGVCLHTLQFLVGRDGAVGIATCYGLDGPGIESRWGGEIFRTHKDRPWGPISLLYNGCRAFPGRVKRPGRGVDHPPPSSAEVKERVELYLYFPLGLRGLFWGEIYLLPLPLPSNFWSSISDFRMLSVLL
jgi:hypothetical protein